MKIITNIREVAKLADVSPATVSRVINGTAKVDEAKRKRVEEVISETGFQPNEVARSLYRKSSKIIGMVVPNIENPFMNEMAKAVEGEAYNKGYRLVLCNSEENSKKEKASIQTLENMKADGIILLTDNEQKSILTGFHIPIVTIDRQIKGKNIIAWLQSNHYEGAALATSHLISCGCKNIVNMRGPQKYSSARERFQGYMDVCAEKGIKPQYIDCEYNFEAGLTKSRELLNQYPNVDGILAANDIVAISLCKVLLQEGYRVPEDIQVVGFDNINLSWIFTPELTTIAQPIKEIGIRAVKILIKNVSEKPFSRENIFPIKLIQRNSTINKKGEIYENFSSR